LFVQQKCKHGKVAFLTFMSVSKHILFALGVDPTAMDAGEGGGSDLVSQATPFAVSCGLVAVHVPSLHKSSIVKPRKTSSKCCRVCHGTKVCFSLFHGSEVIARLTSCTKGKLCNVHVAHQKLATCSAYRYTYVD